MEDIRSGKVNCVIVKDLSRFGRNYIEAGNYIERVFPFLGVCFIAINDSYDSIDKNQSDSLIIPFKNLINDVYCKDIPEKGLADSILVAIQSHVRCRSSHSGDRRRAEAVCQQKKGRYVLDGGIQAVSQHHGAGPENCGGTDRPYQYFLG